MMSLLSVLVTVVAYILCRSIYMKTKSALLNPILWSIIVLIALLLVTGWDYEHYYEGGQYISFLLGPIVVILSIPLYKNRDKIHLYLWPIVGGIVAGIVTTLISVVVLSKLLGLDEIFMKSLYAKSITTPLAVEVTKMVDGIEGLTIVSVILTGIIGATIAPVLLKLVNVKEDIAKGIGIGASSHGIGTSKAVEMGEEIAGASGLAMSITGIVTVVLASIILGG